MADEFKSIRDNLFKVLTGKGDRDETPDDGVGALLGAIFQRAGKGKDEVVGIVAREIGVAVAAMLKEPMAALAKNQKLQISFEFVPKDGVAEDGPRSKKPRRTAAAQKRKSLRRTKADI